MEGEPLRRNDGEGRLIVHTTAMSGLRNPPAPHPGQAAGGFRRDDMEAYGNWSLKERLCYQLTEKVSGSASNRKSINGKLYSNVVESMTLPLV